MDLDCLRLVFSITVNMTITWNHFFTLMSPFIGKERFYFTFRATVSSVLRLSHHRFYLVKTVNKQSLIQIALIKYWRVSCSCQRYIQARWSYLHCEHMARNSEPNSASTPALILTEFVTKTREMVSAWSNKKRRRKKRTNSPSPEPELGISAGSALYGDFIIETCRRNCYQGQVRDCNQPNRHTHPTHT